MRLALLSLVLLAPTSMQTPVRVEATISPGTVPVGASATLTITVATRGPEPDFIEPPRLPSGLEVLRTSDYTEFQFTLPGGRSRVVRREILLVARAPGRFTIPPVSIRVQGRRYQTRSLTLLVTAGATAGNGPTPGRGPGDEVILRASVVPETVFVGQQTTFQAEALFSADVEFRLRRSPEYEPPNPSGFWIHDLPDPPSTTTQVVGDQVYAVQTFRRAFFPLAPGRYTIPPARLAYEVYGGYFSAAQTRELRSDSLQLVVLPLPEAGRPSSFGGAVGRFAVRARVEPEEVPAGETALLTLEVEGRGNVKALPPPSLPELPGVEVYPPGEDAVVEVVDGQVRGVKRFTWILVPRRSGRIELPAIEYAYFDPDRRAYELARTRPLTILARAGREEAADAGDGQGTAHDPRPGSAGRRRLAWLRSPATAALALPLVPLLGLVWVVRRRRRAARAATPPQLRPAPGDARALAELASPPALADPELLTRLGKTFRAALAAQLGVPELARATPDAVHQILQTHGASSELAQSAAELLNRIEHARFAPDRPGPETRRALVSEAQRLVDAIARERRRARRPRWARRLLVLLLLAMAVSSTAAPAADGLEDRADTRGVARR
ncbi:MAG TPA: BatD family protein [Longimicrobiales bacterium]